MRNVDPGFTQRFRLISGYSGICMMFQRSISLQKKIRGWSVRFRHAMPFGIGCKLGLFFLFVVQLLFVMPAALSADLAFEELDCILKDVQLRNTWFMYSKEDGKNHAYHFQKDGSLLDCSSSLSNSQQFGIGSNTKTMTALLIIQAVEEGRLKLDSKVDEIARQIEAADLKAGRPVFPIEVHRDFHQITLKNLLTHHAGFPGVDTTDFAFPVQGGRDALMRKILRMGPVGYRQESKDTPFCFHYSNEGYAVLGEVLERISYPPDTFENLLRKKLFIPLGIGQCHLISTSEALRQAGEHGLDAMAAEELDPLLLPANGASCSLNDWMTFIRYIMNGINGNPTSQKVLRKPESFALLKETQENCYYGTGALMLSKKPSAAYHFGANGIHSSFFWFQLGRLEKGMGTSIVVASTEPFYDVYSHFYLLAELIQNNTIP